MRGEFSGACFERLGFPGERGYAWRAGVLGHRAGLERAEVAVHRRTGLCELALHSRYLALLLVVKLDHALVCVGDRTVDQVVIVEHLP
ncbi:MAG TPA: hypothetical protein VK781_03125 [Solirubrobacteraceae bacterium]|nr:hypothetical protein [Solirubrobacteraceae bacterium]